MERHGERSDELKVFQQKGLLTMTCCKNARLLQKLEEERFG